MTLQWGMAFWDPLTYWSYWSVVAGRYSPRFILGKAHEVTALRACRSCDVLALPILGSTVRQRKVC